jgi:hypothetical protein
MIFQRSLEVLAGTPPVLRAMVENLPPDVAELRPAEGAWSPAEVLAHLLHVETTVSRPRLHRLAQEDRAPFQRPPPMPPPGEPAVMLAAWTTARVENLAWLRELTPEQRQHVDVHPRHGEITLDTHVAEWAYHDLDHLRQILSALSAELYPHIGTWQQLYTPPTQS